MDLQEQHEHGLYWEAVGMICDVTMDDVNRGVLTSKVAVTTRVREAVTVDTFIQTPELAAWIPKYTAHANKFSMLQSDERNILLMRCDCLRLIYTNPDFKRLPEE